MKAALPTSLVLKHEYRLRGGVKREKKNKRVVT